MKNTIPSIVLRVGLQKCFGHRSPDLVACHQGRGKKGSELRRTPRPEGIIPQRLGPSAGTAVSAFSASAARPLPVKSASPCLGYKSFCAKEGRNLSWPSRFRPTRESTEAMVLCDEAGQSGVREG